MPKSLRVPLLVLFAILALTLGATAPAVAVADDFRRGPDPTEENLLAPLGSFSFSRITVPRSQVSGFGGGTIYYPDDTSEGAFGGIAVVPGFLSPENAVSWLGPRLASRGFVVMTIATSEPQDHPDSRGGQLLAALDYLTGQSPAEVRHRLDPARLAVMGHSMGGGGTLRAVADRPSLKAAVPLAPYHQDKTWESVTTPTLAIAGSADFVASADEFARPIYEGLTSARERGLLNITGATHGAFTRDSEITGRYATAWLKRFVDEDTRYDEFVCPATPTPGVTEYLTSCPVS